MFTISWKEGDTAVKKAATKRSRFSLALILSGILVVASAVALEAYRYPWATVFGGNQTDSALPDPPPIVWDGGDREVSTPDSNASSASSAATILPGNESQQEDTRSAGYTELGIIKIPKLGLSQHVLEGTQKQMHYGVGHVTGTAPMGAPGNCALAGHNTTSFRYLGKLAAGDQIILKVGRNIFTYSVFRSFTVLPTDVYVLNQVPNENAALTLITCTPYLTATHRLIVQARLIGANGLAPSSAPGPGYEVASGLVPESSAPPG